MKRRNLKAIAITLLATAMLFTACGAAGPVYTRATMQVHYVR
jgi:predicted small lipoprotein YifL